MVPLFMSFLSSTNALLDRRFEYAKAFVARGEHKDALDLLQQTVIDYPTARCAAR
jgi:Flp pilus assembly protein TadD